MTAPAGWRLEELPPVVGKLLRLGAIVVGSQAELYAKGLAPSDARDWDLLVPFTAWRRVAMSIPKTARPNGNRGWRFACEGPEGSSAPVSVDAWPDDLTRFLVEATSTSQVKARPGFQHAVLVFDGVTFTAGRS